MECYPLKQHFLSRTTLVSRYRGSGNGSVLDKRVVMELQSEVHSWGSSSNEPFFPSASFSIEGEMLFVGRGLWQVGMILALKERISSLPEACCACPTALCPLFLTSFLNCSCGLFLRDTLACRSQFICSPLLTTGESAHCSLEMLHW